MADQSAFGRMSVVMRVGDGGGSAPAATETFTPAAEKYEITGSVGHGGMGEVLLVEDKDLRRQIAMKVLRPEMASSATHRLKFVTDDRGGMDTTTATITVLP